MPVLTSQQRKLLDDACVKGRRASEQAVRAALGSLAVTAERPPAHLSEEDRQLRRGLRAKSRQLGDRGDKLDLLIAECAYEQWHRLLFARFLAENNLLIHPEYRAPVTLEDCEDLAESLGEPDGWAVAGRFAAEILPGIFRLDDPCVQLRLAPEGRLALEKIVAALPSVIFSCDDALGWVYQYWQKEQKDVVNRSGRKIAGPDVGPVTQLFTEPYMVRFLLENTLGAWWAYHHPTSPLVEELDYLKFDTEGCPLAGSFDTWPTTVSEVSFQDPCCGSGQFLVEAFKMLWRMRAEEQHLSAVGAQDAVLAQNLFGLEIDPRCVQIAMFAVVLQAWKDGGGWRAVPTPNIACSGVPVKASLDEWKALAKGDDRLQRALAQLHVLFREADTLGSLIDPRSTTDHARFGQATFDDVDWDDVAPLISTATAAETNDPALAVLGAEASAMSRATSFLDRTYTLIATNPPFLSAKKQGSVLLQRLQLDVPDGSADLATAFLSLLMRRATAGGHVAMVTPQNWHFQGAYSALRKRLLSESRWRLVARLGTKAFSAGSTWDFHTMLVVHENSPAEREDAFGAIDVSALTFAEKAKALASNQLVMVPQRDQVKNPDARVILATTAALGPTLEDYAVGRQGIKTGDDGRYRRQFWEQPLPDETWAYFQSSFPSSAPYVGRSDVVRWEEGRGSMAKSSGARIVGKEAWGRRGVMVSQMGDLPVTLYAGDLFDTNASPLIPKKPSDLPAIWHFCSSDEYHLLVREIDTALKVTNRTLAKVPFDIERWRRVAEEAGPLPEPSSLDPTQWLFSGRPEQSSDPLHASVGRLVGYRWPEQPPDDLEALSDSDGIVCLPSVRGERPAADRLQQLITRAFGGTWSPARAGELIAAGGSNTKDLDSWLRDDFFKAHCQVFKNRPFIWQVWDGRKDGFSALVNCHRLDRSTLEKLAYSYLGDWIERQAAGVRDDVAGAEERLAAARSLQQKVEFILGGEPPCDIYVRWKSLAEQPIGWEPDLNDGVRVNIRPFVEAGILRSKVNVKWDKDRGKNADGSDRLNDLHYTGAQKQAARGASA